TARKNRGAGVGLFVHSRHTAPAGTRELARYGNDVVVIWDAEDEASDILLRAGLMVATAISVRARAESEGCALELGEMESAIRTIEKQCEKFDVIRTKCNTIKSSADAIVDAAEIG